MKNREMRKGKQKIEKLLIDELKHRSEAEI